MQYPRPSSRVTTPARLPTRAALAALVGGAALALAAAPLAANTPEKPGWSDPEYVDEGSSPTVGLNHDGDGVVFFQQESEDLGMTTVASVYADEEFGDTELISARAAAAESKRIDLRGDDVTLRWRTPDQHRHPLIGWRSSEGGIPEGDFSFPGEHTLPPLGGGADVAENSRGQTVSAWLQGPGDELEVWVAYREGPHLPWDRQMVGVVDELAPAPMVTIDETGTATVVWSRTVDGQGPGFEWEQLMATEHRGGVWWRTIELTPRFSGDGRPFATSELTVATNADGDLVIAFRACELDEWAGECATENGVQAITRQSGSHHFGPPTRVWAHYEGDTSDLEAAMTASGTAVISYNSEQGWWAGGDQQRVATSSNGTSWGHQIASLDTIGETAIAANSVGDGVVAWVRGEDGERQSVWAASFDDDGALGESVRVSDVETFNAEPALAVSDTGTALVAWANAEDAIVYSTADLSR